MKMRMQICRIPEEKGCKKSWNTHGHTDKYPNKEANN